MVVVGSTRGENEWKWKSMNILALFYELMKNASTSSNMTPSRNKSRSVYLTRFLPSINSAHRYYSLISSDLACYDDTSAYGSICRSFRRRCVAEESLTSQHKDSLKYGNMVDMPWPFGE